MKTFKQFSGNLTENYKRKMADELKQLFRKPTTKDEFEKTLEHSSRSVEKRLGGSAWKDYKKDAIAMAKEMGLIKKKDTKRYPYYIRSYDDYDDSKIGVTQREVDELVDKFTDMAGASFPDGDPLDNMNGYYRKKDWDPAEANELLDKALKKKRIAKSAHDYLADIWDDAYGDAKSDYEAWVENGKKGSEPFMYNTLGGSRARNPWK